MTGSLILHQYAGSPFAEKVRLMLGFKGLAWQAVSIPAVMPKPDLVALTGGYRKTPVLQVGADVYGDTALIARVLEQRQPEPTLYPPAQPLAPLLAQWADSTLFWTVIPYAMQPAGLASIFAGVPPDGVQAFGADRASFTAGMRRQTPADAGAALQRFLPQLEARLAAGPQLCGDTPSIADFSVAHCLWYVRRAGPLAAILAPYPALNRWLDTMLAIGHGPREKLGSADALAIAAAATAHAPCAVEPGLGFEPGEAVTVAANDYGTDLVAGTLVGLSLDEVVLRRVDPRAGTLHVHFPRIGFQLKKEKR